MASQIGRTRRSGMPPAMPNFDAIEISTVFRVRRMKKGGGKDGYGVGLREVRQRNDGRRNLIGVFGTVRWTLTRVA